ncbi:major facilitator superfamily domain-containing protein [Elsinoe ampelina]|uniref:Major facilitator superfamily domain-containing protein n=1 Tax=Elsinoe ampelina TaxID=302913 RepID=A0A6A6GGL1_9PEZI|nr:major facilitator superfamily domain-containing protein [Elsinoe ampelina]
MAIDTVPSEKSSVEQSEASKESPSPERSFALHERIEYLGLNDKHLSRADVIRLVDEIANDPHVSLETFAHLDLQKILRKIDLRLIPMLALLYLLSFLDRGNIGNAKIEGLQEDLRMTGSQYNWCLTAFFFTYCAFEVPSNMLLKKFRPSIYLASIMVAWGTVMTLMGIVRNYTGLLIARIFLGIAEAGLFPGVAYFLTMWYCRFEVQTRQALFFSAASIAGAFSGLLAYGISFMDGVGNLEGWRWIFILEGIATVLVAFIAFYTLYDYPQTAPFLTIEERIFIVHRLNFDGQDVKTDSHHRVVQSNKFGWHYVRQAFSDPQIFLNIIVYWGYVCPLYGISLFLPTIIRELGHRTTTAQLLTVPIYITASIITIIVALLADRKRLRSPFILAGLVFQLIGFAMCISTSSPGVTYAGIFIAGSALYQCQPSNITWLSNNLAGSYKRAVGMGIQISVGNLAGAHGE